MKRCSRCFIEKLVSEFYKKCTGRDGLAAECQPCSIARAKRRVEAKRDEVAAYQKQYDEAHKEEKRLYDMAYRAGNAERLREQSAAYYANDAEHFRAKAATYLKTSAGKETARRAGAKRRGKMSEIEVNFTAQEHEELLRLYDGRCYVCRLAPATTLDHVVPVSKGGAHTAANLRPCCKPCNSSKNAKDVLDWLEPRWRPVWSAPLVPNYEVSDRHKAELAQILERI